MSRWYVDTSAAAKLLVREAESGALARELDDHQPELVSSQLLETELRRAAHGLPGVTQEQVTILLDGMTLLGVPDSLFREAGLLPGEDLRSLDALHLAAALRIGVDFVITYDLRLARAAREVGLTVLAPA